MSQPIVIKAYNQRMGGVDLIESYRPGTTMTEMFLFVKILNVSVGAIWQLFQRANPDSKMTHLEIRTYITLVLIKSEYETSINQENYGERIISCNQDRQI